MFCRYYRRCCFTFSLPGTYRHQKCHPSFWPHSQEDEPHWRIPALYVCPASLSPHATWVSLSLCEQKNTAGHKQLHKKASCNHLCSKMRSREYILKYPEIWQGSERGRCNSPAKRTEHLYLLVSGQKDKSVDSVQVRQCSQTELSFCSETVVG